MKLFFRWFLLAAALMLVAHTCPGVEVKSYTSALVAAAVLGLLNTLLRPILVLLTLPVTVVTLGLFLFVINAVIFYFAGRLLDGFEVNGAWSSLIGSLMYTALGVVVDWVTERSSDRD